MKARGKRERSERVAPGNRQSNRYQPRRGVITRRLFRPFRPQLALRVLIQGRRASRLPLAIIYRTFGAVSPVGLVEFEGDEHQFFGALDLEHYGSVCSRVIEGGAKLLTSFHQDSINSVDNIARLERNVHLRVDGACSDDEIFPEILAAGNSKSIAGGFVGIRCERVCEH